MKLIHLAQYTCDEKKWKKKGKTNKQTNATAKITTIPNRLIAESGVASRASSVDVV